MNLFDIDSADGIAEFLEHQINAPVVRAHKSTLGGAERVSVMILVALDPRETWPNGILENSHYFRMSLDRDGTLEQFTRSSREDKKFRKTRAKSWVEVAEKINKYIQEIR